MGQPSQRDPVKSQDQDAALAEFSRAIELDPGDVLALTGRGKTLRKMGRHDEALADYSRAIELSPGDALGLTGRGHTYRLMGRHEEALADYNRAIELSPAFGSALANRGETYRLMKQYEEARADFSRAIEVDPGNARVIERRGEMYRLMERYEEALADFSRAIELDPGDAWAVARRGLVYQAMERYEEALADFSRAIKLDPSAAWVIARRRETYRLKGRHSSRATRQRESAVPEVARARLARIREGGSWDSQLSVQEFAAIRSAGFDPVGQVLGAAVFHIDFAGQSGRHVAVADTSSGADAPFAGLVRSMYEARWLALDRAVAQCEALGGDGIVGGTFRVARFPAGGMEITVTGTAVRARSKIRPARPFTSHVTGQEFGKLAHAGWIPVQVVLGICIVTRHDSWRSPTRTTALAPGSRAGNREIGIYTQLVSDARRGARKELARNAKAHGGDGIVMQEMELLLRQWECRNEGQHDLTAEAIFVGTSIARFGRSRDQAVQQPLSVLMLSTEPTMKSQSAAPRSRRNSAQGHTSQASADQP